MPVDDPAKPKLLVVELWGLGDLVIATPFLQAATKNFSVTVLAKPYGEDLRARLWPQVKVIPFIAPWTAFHHKYRLLAWPWRELANLRRLRTERFDVGLSARWDPRDHFLLSVAGARRRLGFPRVGSGVMLTDPLALPGKSAHRYEYWRVVGQALGLDMPLRGRIPTPSRPRMNQVLVHTGAGQPVRVWPLERYRKLVARLRQEGLRVQVVCDPDQRGWWTSAGEVGVTAPTTVTALTAVIDQAAAFVGNDSGPGHLAAFCGVPTFTLFGPQLPEWFAPLHVASEWVEGAPCQFKPCFDYCRFPAPHCLLNVEEEGASARILEFAIRHAGDRSGVEISPRPPVATPEPGGSVRRGGPRRVLHVHNGADLYGASRSLLRMVKAIDRRRFQPLVVLPEPGPLKELIEAQGVEVLLHPKLSIITRPVFSSWRLIPFLLNGPLSVLFLWRVIRQRQIEVVHTNTGVIISPALAARLAGVPHLWHIRDWFQEFRSFWPAFSWYITSFSRKVITASNAIASQFVRRANVVVIHNGFSLEEFRVPKSDLRAGFRTRYGLGDHFVVGCVGRIKLVRKGQEVLLHATALLKARGLLVKALVVGKPFPGNEEHLQTLQRLVRELGIEENVVFTGELSDARPAYAAMDVLAMTSVQPEPFGGVVMEAMSMGLPVIATSIGGSLEQVVDGVTGLMVPPGDTMALAAAIERLAADCEVRERMGKAGVERIATQFSLEETIVKIEALFEETAAARRP